MRTDGHWPPFSIQGEAGLTQPLAGAEADELTQARTRGFREDVGLGGAGNAVVDAFEAKRDDLGT
ncbi:MAG: hypothetical protein ACK6BG_14275 [Cyanobacteriota bacterium]